MSSNPYKYKGPLDPEKDSLVCVPRSEDVNRVIEGIMTGQYWAVMGPRQIGKTTFLRQIQQEFPEAYYIYLDFSISHSNEEAFYRWLINLILSKVSPDQKKDIKISRNWKKENPEFKFFSFLETFKTKDQDKKIIFLIDEIDSLPVRRTFLHLWRKVFIDRYEKETLNQYAVIITGSVDLIALTIGPTSPFNIAEILYLKDFSDEESEILIDEPMKQSDINIEPEAKKHLIDQVSGQPQLLQQVCHILVKTAKKKKIKQITLTKQDIEYAIENLFKESSTLDTLRREIEINDILADLVRDLLKGKEKKFFQYKEFSISGVGAIVDNNNYCSIRNILYERVLRHILKIPLRPKLFICYSHLDDQWRELLLEHLKALENQDILEIWDDQRLQGGQEFSPEIVKNLKSTDIAIFLISEHSLASEFVMKKEIPILLEQKDKGKTILFPILINECVWKTFPWLAKMDIRPKDQEPISEKTGDEQRKLIVEVVKEIARIAESIKKK